MDGCSPSAILDSLRCLKKTFHCSQILPKASRLKIYPLRKSCMHVKYTEYTPFCKNKSNLDERRRSLITLKGICCGSAKLGTWHTSKFQNPLSNHSETIMIFSPKFGGFEKQDYDLLRTVVEGKKRGGRKIQSLISVI